MLSSKLQRVETGQGFTVEAVPLWESIFLIEKELCNELANHCFAGVVYNPLDYAQEVHCSYLQRYMNTPKHVLFLGLNPGPIGMCQTGVRGEFRYITYFFSPINSCLHRCPLATSLTYSTGWNCTGRCDDLQTSILLALFWASPLARRSKAANEFGS